MADNRSILVVRFLLIFVKPFGYYKNCTYLCSMKIEISQKQETDFFLKILVYSE